MSKYSFLQMERFKIFPLLIMRRTVWVDATVTAVPMHLKEDQADTPFQSKAAFFTLAV